MINFNDRVSRMQLSACRVESCTLEGGMLCNHHFISPSPLDLPRSFPLLSRKQVYSGHPIYIQDTV